MDAKEVLRYFIDKSNDCDAYFQCNLASNAVLDWFGRTIRGNRAIEQFLRQDVWPQYEQNFPNAVVCNSIETKPTHMPTKETPAENLQSRDQPAMSCKNDFESPPQTMEPADKPPPLTRGKRFLKEEDEKSSDMDVVMHETETKYYNLRPLTGDVSGESRNVIPNSPRKHRNGVRSLRKRLADSEQVASSAATSSTKRTKSTSLDDKSPKSFDKIGKVNQSAVNPCSSTSTQSAGECSKINSYSGLKYLESVGSIRTIRRVKHPGINKVPSVKTNVVTPFISPESQNGWDRKTKLKLSYRISGNDIQFALIVYEPLSMVSRRNLLEEFQRAAVEDEQASSAMVASKANVAKKKDENSLKIKPNAKTIASVRVGKPKNDKLASLRRLRF